MPFDATVKAVYGEDAKTPEKWAREAFCAWLEGKLNDADGPYAEALGLTPERPAFVLDNGVILKSMYSRPDSPPVVSVIQGATSGADWSKKIEGVVYKGRRLEIELALDTGIKDRAPADDNVASERTDDANLSGFVTDIVNRSYNELMAMGLCDVSIEPHAEMMRAGQGRRPQLVKFFIRVLRDWTP